MNDVIGMAIAALLILFVFQHSARMPQSAEEESIKVVCEGKLLRVQILQLHKCHYVIH